MGSIDISIIMDAQKTIFYIQKNLENKNVFYNFTKNKKLLTINEILEAINNKDDVKVFDAETFNTKTFNKN